MTFVSFANVSENYLDERNSPKSKSTFAIFFFFQGSLLHALSAILIAGAGFVPLLLGRFMM